MSSLKAGRCCWTLLARERGADHPREEKPLFVPLMTTFSFPTPCALPQECLFFSLRTLLLLLNFSPHPLEISSILGCLSYLTACLLRPLSLCSILPPLRRPPYLARLCHLFLNLLLLPVFHYFPAESCSLCPTQVYSGSSFPLFLVQESRCSELTRTLSSAHSHSGMKWHYLSLGSAT